MLVTAKGHWWASGSAAASVSASVPAFVAAPAMASNPCHVQLAMCHLLKKQPLRWPGGITLWDGVEERIFSEREKELPWLKKPSGSGRAAKVGQYEQRGV